MKQILCMLLVVLVSNAFGTEPNVSSLLTNITRMNGEFSIVPSADTCRAGVTYVYVARYDYVEFSAKGSFSLVLVAGMNTNTFKLAFFDSSCDIDAAFDLLNPDAKCAAARVLKDIPISLAQYVYTNWVAAIGSAKGFGSSAPSDGQRFRITVFSFDSGFLSGEAAEAPRGSTVGRIENIAFLLRRYSLAKPSSMDEAEILKVLLAGMVQ